MAFNEPNILSQFWIRLEGAIYIYIYIYMYM